MEEIKADHIKRQQQRDNLEDEVVDEQQEQQHCDIFSGRIVIIVKDDRSLLQLRDYLTAGNNGNDVVEARLRQFITQQASRIR